MENINGFEVIGDRWVNEVNCYKCNAKCKVCGKEFVTNYHALRRMKSCGCARPSQLAQIGEYVNGFRVLEDYAYTISRLTRWALVECKVCKRRYDVAVNNLKYRKHCGCMKKDVIACKYVKSHPQLAQSFRHMMTRCYRKNSQDYYNYGARGIVICDEWLEDRNRFCEWSLLNGFENGKKLSIDRIDNNKDYSPDNCKWSNATTQARNTRRNVMTLELARQVRFERGTMTTKKLADKFGVCHQTITAIFANKIWKES